MTVLAKLAAVFAAALGGDKPAFADARRRGVRMPGIVARSRGSYRR